jgi:uncharacterized protein DUF6916
VSDLVGDPGLDDFSGRIGRAFLIEIGDDRAELVLDAAQALAGSPRGRGGFRLEFVGPPEPVLVQGVFPLAIDDERFEIFLVAIAREPAGMRYEAVFF